MGLIDSSYYFLFVVYLTDLHQARIGHIAEDFPTYPQSVNVVALIILAFCFKTAKKCQFRTYYIESGLDVTSEVF